MVKIFLMRHGESISNELKGKIQNACSDRKISTGQEDDKLEEIKCSDDPNILNSKLSQTGIKQCIKARKKLKRWKNIKHVVISPLRRVFETLEYLFEEYPSFINKDLKIHIMPDLREMLCSASDLACWTDNEVNSLRYPKYYDWEFLNQTASDPFFWFLDQLSKKEQERCKQMFVDIIPKDGDEFIVKRDKLLKTFSDHYSKDYKIESQETCHDRVNRAKLRIIKILEDYNVQDKELIVISHASILGHLTSTEKTKQFVPKKYTSFYEGDIKKY